MYENKFNLNKQQSLFIAKKLLAENIYCGAKIEEINVTFLDIKNILNGVNVKNINISEIETILNLRDAYKYVLNNFKTELNLEYICKVNDFVARNESLEWGKLRNGTVGISGVRYIPPILNELQVKTSIKNILDKNISITEKAIEYFLYGCRSQMFWDGNKRTSLIVANKIIISRGCWCY
ncbi:MAG: Fic family protein [Clostridia bacterium]